jgi:hypothetical protein
MATKTPDINEPEHITQANRVIALLDRNPGLRNNVILRLLERGDITENIRYLIDELKLKVAAPWQVGESKSKDSTVRPHWFRTDLSTHRGTARFDAGVIRQKVDEFTFSVAVYTDRKRGTSETFEDARDRADAIMSANGWVLL